MGKWGPGGAPGTSGRGPCGGYVSPHVCPDPWSTREWRGRKLRALGTRTSVRAGSPLVTGAPPGGDADSGRGCAVWARGCGDSLYFPANSAVNLRLFSKTGYKTKKRRYERKAVERSSGGRARAGPGRGEPWGSSHPPSGLSPGPGQAGMPRRLHPLSWSCRSALTCVRRLTSNREQLHRRSQQPRTRGARPQPGAHEPSAERCWRGPGNTGAAGLSGCKGLGWGDEVPTPTGDGARGEGSRRASGRQRLTLREAHPGSARSCTGLGA